VYRPETFGADILCAARDLMAWGHAVADEDLGQGHAEETHAIWRLLDEANGEIADLSHEIDQDEDPVRSVRTAIALLHLAEADDAAGGWGAIADGLERRLWARGPVVPATPRPDQCFECEDLLGEHGTPDPAHPGALLCDECAGSLIGTERDGGTDADDDRFCDVVGVSKEGVPYACVREPNHAEHHLSPDGWRWEDLGPWRNSPPDFVPEAIVLGRVGAS
jgi:hypothetical protein